MNEKNLKIIGVLALAVIVVLLHIKLYRFAEVVHHGALRKLICLGRVVNVDTSENVDQILTFRILSGQFRGETVNVDNIWIGRKFSDRTIKKNDVLFLEIPLRHQNQSTINEVPHGRVLSHSLSPVSSLAAGDFDYPRRGYERGTSYLDAVFHRLERALHPCSSDGARF